MAIVPKGSVTQIMGPVVDVCFKDDEKNEFKKYAL